MKKLFAFVLAFTLVTAMAVPALAAESTTGNNVSVTEDCKQTSIPVSGSYKGSGSGEVVSVDLVWDAMDFTYTDADNGTWNPKTHTYDGSATAHWAWSKATEDQTAPNITLTNHSNTGVKADFAFNTGITGLNGTFSDASGTALTNSAVTLATAVGTAYAEAPQGRSLLLRRWQQH